MLSKLAALFRIPELKTRLLYTLALLAVYRIGIFITTPGVDRSAMRAYIESLKQQGGGFLSLFNFFSGGAVENASIFALGVMPYITASIIMSMLGIIIPSVERLQKEGEQGRKKINQYTRYGCIVIASFYGLVLSRNLMSRSSVMDGIAVVNPDWAVALGGFGFPLITILTLTAGTCFIMWLGERITERGIGNGMSLIIFAGIVARLPNAVYATVVGIQNQTYQPSEMFILGLVMLCALAGIVFMEKGQRRIPIQYAKRVVGNRQYGGQSTYLPMKINMAGVIPPIFASSFLSFPAAIASYIGLEWMQKVQQFLMPGSWKYELLFVGLIVAFSYFYTAIQFNHIDVSDNLKKSGGFVPGIRPGKETAEYIDYILSRINFFGALYLSAICVLPVVIQKLVSNQVPFYFGGTGLLIVVSVALDTVQQIEGHFITKEYDASAASANLVRIRARQETES